MEIGKDILNAMARRGETVPGLAHKVGCSERTIYRLLADENVSSKVLIAAMQELGLRLRVISA